MQLPSTIGKAAATVHKQAATVAKLAATVAKPSAAFAELSPHPTVALNTVAKLPKQVLFQHKNHQKPITA